MGEGQLGDPQKTAVLRFPHARSRLGVAWQQKKMRFTVLLSVQHARTALGVARQCKKKITRYCSFEHPTKEVCQEILRRLLDNFENSSG